MSYFRGTLYAWNDGEDALHLSNDSGDFFIVPRDQFDQLAVMRLAELIRDDRLDSAIYHAISGGNAGGLWLRDMAGELKSRLRSLVVE